MARVAMEPLGDEHLDAAAALLADRHARHLASDPLLPADVDYRAAIAGELAAPNASGIVAVEGGEVRAYLIGRHADDPVSGGTRVFVDTAGHAAVESELLREAYATLAAEWVGAGHVRHQVLVPPADAVLRDAWERLSFALQHVLAARPVERADTRGGVAIRQVTPFEPRHGAAFDRLLYLQQLETPSFSGVRLPSEEEFLAEWSEEPAPDETFTHFLAEVEGRVVGHALLYVRPRGDLRIPERAIDLAHVVTLPEQRGMGVGVALTHHALAWAHEHGYRVMTTDWRSSNLLSSRFWPRRGFRPTFLRLYRSIP